MLSPSVTPLLSICVRCWPEIKNKLLLLCFFFFSCRGSRTHKHWVWDPRWKIGEKIPSMRKSEMKSNSMENLYQYFFLQPKTKCDCMIKVIDGRRKTRKIQISRLFPYFLQEILGHRHRRLLFSWEPILPIPWLVENVLQTWRCDKYNVEINTTIIDCPFLSYLSLLLSLGYRQCGYAHALFTVLTIEYPLLPPLTRTVDRWSFSGSLLDAGNMCPSFLFLSVKQLGRNHKIVYSFHILSLSSQSRTHANWKEGGKQTRSKRSLFSYFWVYILLSLWLVPACAPKADREIAFSLYH